MNVKQGFKQPDLIPNQIEEDIPNLQQHKNDTSNNLYLTLFNQNDLSIGEQKQNKQAYGEKSRAIELRAKVAKIKFTS